MLGQTGPISLFGWSHRLILFAIMPGRWKPLLPPKFSNYVKERNDRSFSIPTQIYNLNNAHKPVPKRKRELGT